MARLKRSDINIMRFDKMKERTVYTIGGTALLFGHIVYLVVFAILGVMPMLFYNIFSVLFYSGMIYMLYRRRYRKRLVLMTLVEIMVHCCLGCLTMGWGMGFGTMLLFLIPIPFYLPLRKIFTPYLFSLVPLGIYIGIAAVVKYNEPSDSTYVFRDTTINHFVYFMNIIFGAMILLYISSIYMFSREVMQYKLIAKNESLKKLATIDPLTQLFNRRAMGEYLKLVQRNSERTGKGYTVGLGDIDDFKNVNDTYGHDAGDEVLKQISSVIARTVPAEGYASRWGGEEFLFIIPNADVEAGVDCAEKIRMEAAAKSFKDGYGKRYGVTITIGVCCGKAGEDIEKVINNADKMLYKGKESGKNKVSHE